MSNDPNETRNSLVAAFVILAVAGLAIYYLPAMVSRLNAILPFLGFAFGAVLVLGFFAIFWLRSRFRK